MLDEMMSLQQLPPTNHSFLMNTRYNYAYGDWPALQVNTSHLGAVECDPFVVGVDHRAAITPIRDEPHCLDVADTTVAVVADSLTSVVGAFVIGHDHDSSVGVSLDTSAFETKEILSQLICPNVSPDMITTIWMKALHGR